MARRSLKTYRALGMQAALKWVGTNVKNHRRNSSEWKALAVMSLLKLPETFKTGDCLPEAIFSYAALSWLDFDVEFVIGYSGPRKLNKRKGAV
ncbi:MAG: hypothetical protein K6T83_06330 [Alicyclobacillus sp.]|nr:hypothetical protein [Alicyclobacillus sp.]